MAVVVAAAEVPLIHKDVVAMKLLLWVHRSVWVLKAMNGPGSLCLKRVKATRHPMSMLNIQVLLFLHSLSLLIQALRTVLSVGEATILIMHMVITIIVVAEVE
jgi:hypothetical protein